MKRLFILALIGLATLLAFNAMNEWDANGLTWKAGANGLGWALCIVVIYINHKPRDENETSD